MNQIREPNNATPMPSCKEEAHRKTEKLNSVGLTSVRHGFPHQGNPSQKYSLNWKIEQAGSGWLSLGNYFGFSIILIKQRHIDKNQAGFLRLQAAFHENLVGLIEAFHEDSIIYLAYNYYDFAVNLSQVGSTPAVRLDEPELASICRSILKGLEYIHGQLHISHGGINSDNILLCSDGIIKIANIGDGMISASQATFTVDRENVGSLLVQLSRQTRLASCLREQTPGQNDGPHLSKYAAHFIEQIGSASYLYLFEHVFLQQVSPDTRNWYLIPHYLDTIMHWGIIRYEMEEP